jgi:hypothetical protein
MTFRNFVLSTVAAASLALTVMPDVAHAEDPQTKATRLQIEEEMKKLAAKNAWAGVETNFQKLIDLKADIPYDDWFLGSQAARNLGKTWEMYQRLEAAVKLKPSDEIQRELDGIDERYGRLKISGNARKHPTMTAAVMPFAPDERKSVEYAMDYVLNTGSFEGMLPLGDYNYGTLKITVAAGKTFQEIDGTKVKGGAAPPPDGNNPPPDGNNPPPDGGVVDRGLIWYAGPVALAGASFTSSPQPATLETPGTMQPSGVAGGGATVDVGAEIGFSDIFGVAPTVGYRSIFGSDNFQGFEGWLAATIRPGNLRIAVGPTYGLYLGSGTGVSPDWNIGQDQVQYPPDSVTYRGFSRCGGAQLTAGYGLFDFSKMQGIVELGGSWQTDGARSYLGGGVRIGIVPFIERYKG